MGWLKRTRGQGLIDATWGLPSDSPPNVNAAASHHLIVNWMLFLLYVLSGEGILKGTSLAGVVVCVFYLISIHHSLSGSSHPSIPTLGNPSGLIRTTWCCWLSGRPGVPSPLENTSDFPDDIHACARIHFKPSPESLPASAVPHPFSMVTTYTCSFRPPIDMEPRL